MFRIRSFLKQGWDSMRPGAAPVPIHHPSLSWLHPPDDEFLRWVRTRETMPYEGMPPDPEQFLVHPSFMLAQVHRLSLLTGLLRTCVTANDFVLDLGAFPFCLDTILREFLHHEGEILATVNLPIPDDWARELDARRIRRCFLNLDPLVRCELDGEQLPSRIPLADGSVDVVIFSHVIEHLYHPIDVLLEISRVLRDDGRVILATDNAFMLNVVTQLESRRGYLHEPVENTGAMTYTTWRGHNRFFTLDDLRTMLRAARIEPTSAEYHEVLYNSFDREHFRHPTESLPRWRAEILSRYPEYRNEIVLVGRRMPREAERSDA